MAIPICIIHTLYRDRSFLLIEVFCSEAGETLPRTQIREQLIHSLFIHYFLP